MQQTMYASLRFFISYFTLHKEARNDFENNIQISAVCSRSLSLSWHYKAQQHLPLVPAPGEDSRSCQDGDRVCPGPALHMELCTHCLPSCSDTQCCYKGHSAAAAGLCLAANICAGVSLCFWHEQQKLCV